MISRGNFSHLLHNPCLLGVNSLIQTTNFKHSLREFRSESFGNLHWLADPRALNDYILYAVILRKLYDFFEQIATQCTTDTAILELDEFFFAICYSVLSY